jgi:protocatechuate 3,4-dioxygenase beta subunit
METPEHTDGHDRGLAYDLLTLTAGSGRALLSRRSALTMLAGAGGGLLLAGCAPGTTAASSSTTATTAGSGATGTACTTIPKETAGPYPGDGSNGPDALEQSGIVRQDIRSSIGTATGVAAGVPLRVRLTVLDTGNGCAPMPGAAVYLWHCDQQGRYSMYSNGVTGENYLRGVQEAAADGTVSFQSIFPAAYSGRWPHIHFEVYDSLASATGGGRPVATSQLALPEDACTAVYATDGYTQSARNLTQTPLARDNVFSDGWASQMAATSGSPSSGYTTALDVPV